MLRFRRIIGGLFAAAVFGAGLGWALSGPGTGCSDAVGQREGPHPGQRSRYSPFLVRVDGSERQVPFDTISFKDVGMSVPAGSRSYVYESIAQSLSHDLTAHPAWPLASRVSYSEANVDPSTHLYCEAGHIYVDIWQDASNETWGYSLWSGCGEDARFAHEQLDVQGNPSRASVEPLTRDIASSLRRAIRSGCFTRRC